MASIQHTNIYKIQEYSRHLKNLKDDDKHSRFGYVASDHTIDQLVLNMCYNPGDHELWYAEIDDQRVGWGHMAKTSAGTWELAVSVNSDHQGKGIGNLLIAEMIAWSKYHKIPEVFMHCIASNKPIQHLAAKHGLQTRENYYGEVVAKVDVPAPTITDINTQWWKETSEILSEYAELRMKLAKLWITPFNQKS